MKKRKALALVTAAVLSVASLPILSASAEDVYTLGDVDMDGTITGHDTAMVSRALYDSTYMLTNVQLQMADMDSNGIVDQADLETLHSCEVYMLGDVENKGMFTLMNAWYALQIDSMRRVGCPVAVEQSGSAQIGSGFGSAFASEKAIDPVSYNLLDADANGTVDVYDAMALLMASCKWAVGEGTYFDENRYDLYREYYVPSRTEFDGKDYSCLVVPASQAD